MFINAVSDKLFSDAISCITLSDNQLSRIQTAAGLPENTFLENASTWYIGIDFTIIGSFSLKNYKSISLLFQIDFSIQE